MPDVGDDCCPNDPNKTAAGSCGCGVADIDSDGDGLADCVDPAPYGWQRQLTVDGAQVSSALTDFPLLIRLTDAHLRSASAANGSDIHFTSADKVLLDHEIESYDAATGTLVAWVRMPSISASVDTVLYLAYGDGKGDRSNAAGVWKDHHFVWHMSQNPGLGGVGDIRDSTQRAHGTALGNMTAANLVPGVAGKGISFDGVDDQIAFTSDITGTGASTLDAWVTQLPDTDGLGGAVISFGNEQMNQARFLFSLETATGKTKIGFYGNDVTGVPLATGVWKHLGWTWDGTNSNVYVDGALVQGPTRHTGANTAGTGGKLGNSTFNSPAYNFFLLGQLDEVRVSTISHTAAWIRAEYDSERPASTFVKIVGAPQPITAL